MQPTDENQPEPMRPNLMAVRRTGTRGEDSILAMLERERDGERGVGVAHPRLARYGAGATLALALAATLAWMAADRQGKRAGRPDLAEAAPAQLRQVPAMPPLRPAGAAIVDQPLHDDGAPPLRLLKPALAAAEPPAPALITDLLPSRPLAQASPDPAACLPAPVARPSSVSLASNTVRPRPSRPLRSAIPGRAAEAPDPDVLLISAVITHANGHAAPGSAATELLCPNGACRPRSPRR